MSAAGVALAATLLLAAAASGVILLSMIHAELRSAASSLRTIAEARLKAEDRPIGVPGAPFDEVEPTWRLPR